MLNIKDELKYVPFYARMALVGTLIGLTLVALDFVFN